MNNKVKFLRGTSGEYAVAEKDSDTIYFTTDDGKLYIGDKEVSGSDITIDDTLSDTSTNPVQNKVVKQAIDNKADKSLYGDTTINVGRRAGTPVGDYSTAEGFSTEANGQYSHAEGAATIARGQYSHAEGNNAIASGDFSHAEGFDTRTTKRAEHASGQYNQSNSDTLFSIGDGTADNARHNAFEITTTGGKLHDKDIATTDLIPTTLPANGGTAETISDWGVQTVSDANNAPYGFSNTSPDSANAPDTFWATILTVGGIANGYKPQFAFPWGAGRVTKYRVQDNGHWGSWINVADGGNADTVDGKHAGDFAASINPTIIGSIKIMGYSTNTVQSIFPDGDTIRIRNLDSETSQTNNYADIIITTSGVFTEKAVNGVWQGRKELLTSTCVTGTSTIVDSNNFVSANFGFTPSAVLYAVYDSKTGIDDNYRLAHNFNSGGFITETHTAPPIGGGIETFSYIAFR